MIWTDEGIELSAKEVSGLSIEDNSVLWGTWVEARVEQPDPSRNHGPFVERTTSSPYQLVVTPLPPDTWPISFCIQLQLADVPHSFTYPTRLLGALGLNILSVRTSPAGFHHTTWTAVCEASELRRKIYHQTRSLRHCLSPSRSKMMDIESQAGDGPDGIVNFDLADLSPEQQDALSRSGQSLVLSQSQQQRLLEAIRTQRGLKIKVLARDTLMLSQEQRAELANSGGVALTSKQVAVACLVERSVPLESNDKAKVWREFAYSFAERVLLRMHEALWCLRIVSHLSQRILEQNKNDPELAMIAAEGMVSAWRKHQKSDLGTIVKAMKYVIDGAGYKYRLEPTLDEKKIFHTAYQKLGFNGYESAESFWSAFCELNQKGFLHYRLLYGQSFLAGEPDGNELFAEYAGNPLEDQPCKGGQSLQRIVNGIKRDGAQDTMASYADVAENLIDRSREWRAHEQMLSDAGESPTLHYKLAFLLNVDGKRRIAKAADGRLLAQLMHLWISMRGDLVRVREFRYRRERSLLQPSGRSMSQTFPNECSLTLPLRSSLSVNALHCVARFFPITDAHQGNLLRVRATYEVRFPKRTAVIEDFVHAANGANAHHWGTTSCARPTASSSSSPEYWTRQALLSWRARPTSPTAPDTLTRLNAHAIAAPLWWMPFSLKSRVQTQPLQHPPSNGRWKARSRKRPSVKRRKLSSGKQLRAGLRPGGS